MSHKLIKYFVISLLSIGILYAVILVVQAGWKAAYKWLGPSTFLGFKKKNELYIEGDSSKGSTIYIRYEGSLDELAKKAERLTAFEDFSIVYPPYQGFQKHSECNQDWWRPLEEPPFTLYGKASQKRGATEIIVSATNNEVFYEQRFKSK